MPADAQALFGREGAVSQFGSGYGGLGVDANRKLGLKSMAHQDSPISQAVQPVLGIDVWEHAYFLQQTKTSSNCR